MESIPKKTKYFAALAQLVEQGTENPCVLGSIPRRGKFFILNIIKQFFYSLFLFK